MWCLRGCFCTALTSMEAALNRYRRRCSCWWGRLGSLLDIMPSAIGWSHCLRIWTKTCPQTYLNKIRWFALSQHTQLFPLNGRRSHTTRECPSSETLQNNIGLEANSSKCQISVDPFVQLYCHQCASAPVPPSSLNSFPLPHCPRLVRP